MKTIGQINYGEDHWKMWKPCFMISPNKNKIIQVTFIPAQEKMLYLGYKRISIWSKEVSQHKNKITHHQKRYYNKCVKHNIPLPKNKHSALWTWVKVISDASSKYARNGMYIKRRRR